MRAFALLTSIAVSLCAAPAAFGETAPSAAAATGGTAYDPAPPAPVEPVLTPGTIATLLPDGRASVPTDAPEPVKAAIAAANEIIGKPYRYGGGHRSFASSGYDCSGTVSYALNGAGLIKSPLDSSRFLRWGKRGKGQWITVYTNRGHAFVVIAGLRLDTSAAGDPSGAKGPRWRPNLRSTRGYRARFAPGF